MGLAERPGVRLVAKVCVALVLALTSCAAPALSLRTGAVSDRWEPIRIPRARIALHNRGGGAMLATYTCDGPKDLSLDVLVNHALIALEPRHELWRRRFVLDGRAALRARVDAAPNGVPVSLDLVVYQKHGCVVDADLVAAPAELARLEGDFTGFVDGLSLSSRGP